MRLYAELHQDCSQVPRRVDEEGLAGDRAAFWRAAGLACSALRSGDEAIWQAARAAWFTAGGRDHAADDCFERAVRDTMQTLERIAGPEFTRRSVELGGSRGGFACTPSSVSLSPVTGPAGTAVTVTWSTAMWLATTMSVTFEGVEAVWTFDEEAGAATYLAPDGLSGSVPVVLHFANGAQVPAGTFTYEPTA